MKRCIIFAIAFSIIGASLTYPAEAAPVIKSSNGLSISPLRQEMSIVAGKSAKGYITVGNLTDKPMIVTTTVKEFSVTDYAYDYVFKSPQNDWVKISAPQVQLAPKTSQKIQYDVAVPAKATPGGYYFALFASTEVVGSGLAQTVQAASPVYVKVEGQLIRTSVFQDASVPLFVTGQEVPYEFVVKNTGNVYFSAYLYGQLEGLFGKQPEVGTGHLLIPHAPRTIEGAVPTPILPGIYKLTYGYKVDFASIITTKSTYILFVPPWSLAALLLAGVIGRWLWQKRNVSKAKQKS